MIHRPWSAADVDLLRQLYPDRLAADVAALLGRNTSTVHQAAARYGIKKSAVFWASDLSNRIQRGRKDPRMAAGQFKPGLVPWNAGLKGWSPPGCERTQFKKGDRLGAAARNWVPVGSYRITTKDQILQQKISDQPGPSCYRWTPVARLVWQAAHGPIPKGLLIAFKPGLKTNVLAEITVDKLDCISRAENAQRNHPRNHYPELLPLYYAKGAITRQVNRIAREAESKSA